MDRNEAITRILELLETACEEIDIWLDPSILAAQQELIDEIRTELDEDADY